MATLRVSSPLVAAAYPTMTIKKRGLGVWRPNLLVVYDNEKGYEFRVQCEVIVGDKRDGASIARLLARSKSDSLKKVKAIVRKHLDPRATKSFREIVNTGFSENITALKAKK